jgi:membrane protein
VIVSNPPADVGAKSASIGIYLGRASFGSTYGASGSLVIVPVWEYYSTQLFSLGVEFTKI